jgi:hypothetical protein
MRGVILEAGMEVSVPEDLFGIVRAVKKAGERDYGFRRLSKTEA